MTASKLDQIERNTVSARIVKRLMSPFQKFMTLEASSGITLIITTLVAMIWANSGSYESYEHFIHIPIGIQIGGLSLIKGLQHWVNDGLMVIFFYVVGLEIKRELITGELSTPKKAALPILAALGGMVAPALFYLIFNHGTPAQHGWAVPVATDIAFAVGVLVLLGKRVPFALKVFLLALAIADDLGAVVVIAAFYTETIHIKAMGAAVVLGGLSYLLRQAGVRYPLVYLSISIALWAAVLFSGVHATISGVVLGFLTPINPLIPRSKIKELVDPYDDNTNEENVEYLREVYTQATSPLSRWIHVLHPWVNFAIMPLFALVNAGVRVADVDFAGFFSHPVAMGIILGLAVGKPVGVVLASWITCRLGLGELPRGINWSHIWGMGCLAGIGFTMALFISHLSLNAPEVEVYSKLGILTASIVSALVGSVILLMAPKAKD